MTNVEGSALRCPGCGAPAAPTDKACAYCGSTLQAARCPWCFEWTFSQTRDCARCGAAAAPEPGGGKPLPCPGCKAPALWTRSLGGATLRGCARCEGVWADPASFKRLCEDRETQAAYLGLGSVLPAPGSVADPSLQAVVYRPCPFCGELMNRFNFAGASGVILDACKPHGVWFDADELRRVVAFIRSGGLDLARERERQELERARKRLEDAQAGRSPLLGAMDPGLPPISRTLLTPADLLKHLFEKD